MVCSVQGELHLQVGVDNGAGAQGEVGPHVDVQVTPEVVARTAEDLLRARVGAVGLIARDVEEGGLAGDCGVGRRRVEHQDGCRDVGAASCTARERSSQFRRDIW
jgi:hypothetical protein